MFLNALKNFTPSLILHIRMNLGLILTFQKVLSWKMFQTVVWMFYISCRDGLVHIWKKLAIMVSLCGTVILINEEVEIKVSFVIT